jgi:Methane oxygenase PmoA
LDESKNPGYPTYWHARGYGLFAANPLGRSIFDPKQPPFNYTIKKGTSVTFRYRVLLFPHAAGPDVMNREADVFQAEYK